MSARSPRSSLSGASSAEVAEDFAESLKDLQINNRYEITNLTIIAKENTEHALAISRALEHHIKTTAPSRKLPALYVLDSIVKNVGTPYTTYLGAHLYSTFMEAYTLVDGQTRRSMEGVLKTWKEPITGSIDPTPVFPLDIVRPIENALIQARTVALQNQRQAPQQVLRDTATPPQRNGFAAPLPALGQQPPFVHGAPQQGFPQQQYYSTPPQQALSTYRPPSQQPPTDVDSLKSEVARLLNEAGPWNLQDQQAQGQIMALKDLERVLNQQRLSEPELQAVRNALSQLAGRSISSQPRFPASQWYPPAQAAPAQQPYLAVPPQPFGQPPPTQPLPAAPILPPGALSSLQALLASNQKPGTPQMRAAAPALQNVSHSQLQNVQTQAAAAPVLNGAELIAALSKNGISVNVPPASSTPATLPPAPAPAALSTADLLRSLQGKLPPLPSTNTPPLQTMPLVSGAAAKPRLTFSATTAATLKTFHPLLVHALYEAQPNQCSTCGRRFLATDLGRTKKQRHLDWHFRTNQRLAENQRATAHHRLFYLDELPWVQHRDFDVSTTSSADLAAATAAATASASAKRPEDQTVLAPPGTTKTTCRICFEDMKAAFHEESQAWVFLNATRLPGSGSSSSANGIVHATCLAELQKSDPSVGGGGGGAAAVATAATTSSLAAVMSAVNMNRQRSATPESSTLGKRKAEGPLAGSAAGAARVKFE